MPNFDYRRSIDDHGPRSCSIRFGSGVFSFSGLASRQALIARGEFVPQPHAPDPGRRIASTSRDCAELITEIDVAELRAQLQGRAWHEAPW